MVILPALTKEELTEIRKEKLRKEIESAKRIIQTGIEPLEIADRLFHESFRILKEGIRNRNPKLSDDEITQLIEDTLTYRAKLKRKRERRVKK